MESEAIEPTPHHAARLLREHDETRERTEQRGPSRSFALFTLWGALVVAIYMGVFLLSFDNRSAAEAGQGTIAYPYSLAVGPILIFSSLIGGARERFGVRSRLTGGYAIAAVIVLAAFLALGVVTILGLGYPWWLNLVVPAAFFAVLAVRPIRLLRRARPLDEEPWTSEPLSRPARWTTAIVGIAFGVVAAASTQPWFPVVWVVWGIFLVVALLGWQARWGLPRAGYEWGPIHWIAFGISVGILFALTALLSLTDGITGWTSVPIGVLVALVMAGAAFLPPRTRRG